MGKGTKLGFFIWYMLVASVGLNLQHCGVGIRAGERAGVGEAWPILMTASVSNDKGKYLLCSGVWEKGKGSCGYEAAPVKLLCGQEFSHVYELELLIWSSFTCLNFSTLNATLVSLLWHFIKRNVNCQRLHWCYGSMAMLWGIGIDSATRLTENLLLNSWDDHLSNTSVNFNKWVV